MIAGYSNTCAKKLYTMKLPKPELPLDIDIIWFDPINPGNEENLFRVGEHKHTFFEVHFVFSGTTVYRCQKSEFAISRGQAILIAPGVYHEYIQRSEDLFKVALAFRINDRSGDPTQLLKDGVKLFEFSSFVIDNIEFIFRTAARKDFIVPHIISGRIAEIIYSLFDAFSIKLPEIAEEKQDPRVSTGIRFISANKNKVISAADVSKECCLSVKQLNRIFKKVTGKTLHEYIVEEKMKYAKKLLCTEARIKEISFDLGFGEPSNFTLFFKRHSGMYPGEYRQLKIGEEEE